MKRKDPSSSRDRHRHHQKQNDRHKPDRHRSNNTQKSNRDDVSNNVTPTFDSMNLKPELLRGIYAYGFEKPSAIQQRAIRPIILGRDVIAQSQSGTGKTAVFSIAALQILNEKITNDPQVLVLSPTRELAEQTQRVIQSLGDFMNVRAHSCVGGKSVGEDMRMFDRGAVQIVSGTPGRVYDLIRRQSLRTKNLACLIMDEADEMLNKGFKEQIYDIYRFLPPSTQVVLISATLPVSYISSL